MIFGNVFGPKLLFFFCTSTNWYPSATSYLSENKLFKGFSEADLCFEELKHSLYS